MGTIDNVDGVFDYLENNSAGMSPDEVISLLFPLTKSMVRRGPRVPAGTLLYRARVFDAPPQDQLRSISSLSYPPVEACRSDQRCNLAGRPVFYGATDVAPCYFEARAANGSYIAVSEWEVTRPLVLQPLGYALEVLRQLGSNRGPPDWGVISREPAHLRFEEHVTRLFTQRNLTPEGYRICAVLTTMHSEGSQVDGVIYPSFEMRGNGDNVALKPASVDSTLLLKHARISIVVDSAPASFRSEAVDTAEIDAMGRLRWKGHDDKWSLTKPGEELRMVSNGYRWFAYDERGLQRPPDP